MNFEACLSLPRDPREAALIADNLDSLARALREWPAEAWRKLAAEESKTPDGLFERLAQRTAAAATEPTHRDAACASAEAAASVLRVMWPESRLAPVEQEAAQATERVAATA